MQIELCPVTTLVCHLNPYDPLFFHSHMLWKKKFSVTLVALVYIYEKIVLYAVALVQLLQGLPSWSFSLQLCAFPIRKVNGERGYL